jgi:hypothetical protein
VSHVVDLDVQVKDIDALRAACEATGTLELVEKSTYKWYGRHVGDYPMPAGFTKADLGKCEFAIKVKGATRDTYEVGVVKRRDGKEGYTFLYDFYAGGNGLIQALYGPKHANKYQAWCQSGNDGKGPIQPLMKEYEAQVGTKELQKLKAKGYSEFTREYDPDRKCTVLRAIKVSAGGQL